MCGFSKKFYSERNYDVLKSKSPCILLNNNTKFNINEKHPKTENPTPSFREASLLPQFIKESPIKSKMEWTEWKITLWKWHTFWMAPCLFCYFIVILFYIERKRFLLRNLGTILPFKSNLWGKFHCFNAIDGSIKMLINSGVFKNVN